jgi:hypothetical protein
LAFERIERFKRQKIRFAIFKKTGREFALFFICVCTALPKIVFLNLLSPIKSFAYKENYNFLFMRMRKIFALVRIFRVKQIKPIIDTGL